MNFLAEVYSKQTSAATSITPSINLVRRASYTALSLASMIFLFINLAYFAAVPKDTLKSSGSLVGAMFCESVFGVDSIVAVRLFPILVSLSCVGGLVATVCNVLTGSGYSMELDMTLLLFVCFIGPDTRSSPYRPGDGAARRPAIP